MGGNEGGGRARREARLRGAWGGGTVATDHYRSVAAMLMRDSRTVLQAGCGWDKNRITGEHRGQRRIVGIDLSERAAKLYHSPFVLASIDSVPFADASFDLVLSDYVVEHLPNPEQSLREMARVLAPGGHLLIVTPNKLSYKSMASTLIPKALHGGIGRMRYGPGAEADMFPTLYRCNTPSRLRRFVEQAGLTDVKIELMNNGPTWFTRMPGVFAAADVYHRLISRPAAASLRCAMVMHARKPA
jgi:ubiquinone/menaquinone biosynthesis C-methylase UbiE